MLLFGTNFVILNTATQYYANTFQSNHFARLTLIDDTIKWHIMLIILYFTLFLKSSFHTCTPGKIAIAIQGCAYMKMIDFRKHYCAATDRKKMHDATLYLALLIILLLFVSCAIITHFLILETILNLDLLNI